jgi:16S rRNA (guanine527-N7)-methyltransferase
MRENIIQDWLSANNHPPLTDGQIEKLTLYQKRLLEVNKHMNLTAITTDEEIAVKHFIDSLTLSPWLFPNTCVIDVGTGAGFPGLVLKIVRPDIRLTLLDSLRKRVFFLMEVSSLLGFADVHCIHARAEETARQPEYKNRYDTVTVRAVARLDKLAGYTLPLLKKGGLLLAMKGPDADAEINEALPAIKKHGGRFIEKKIFTVADGLRHTVAVVGKA